MVLYSNHCPQCIVLESKLKEKNIEFTIENNIKVMREKGFSFLPVLELDNGELLSFPQAYKKILEGEL